MDKKIKKGTGDFKIKVVISVIVIIFVIIMRITSTTQLGLGPVESIMREVFNPAQTASYSAGNGIVNFFKGLVDYKNVKDENDEIKKDLARLETENNILQEYKVENETLKKTLDLQKSNKELQIVTGEVVGRSIKEWYKTISINKGSNDGIKENMPVITYKGLVGRVTSVTNSTAEVTLITDSKYGAVAALAKEIRYPGIVIGEDDGSNQLKMIQIPSDAPIQEGFEIITSGLGDMTYKNLKIGKVKSIENASDGLMKEAIIEPYENLNSLDFVMVITSQE
ncbi:hypothetical protein AZF37_05840 [endosymbiont 'TC1' of Trimyema compressum]|uniref:rod shape-determining protein MreC n=1 Tax=endosymbiont 'TC1' of Trimyema compressum TaxID=243899 RepID=UPI0007F04F43|nr:rod shape-determining protein MreC [endosymbiont 'TC1' of Trimyema compressum]AMP20761.1 hypothetical protein AZF37_05840 [endosymbiont 'TC1' of Trimyema compressum]